MFLDFLGACVYIGIVFSVGQWTVKRLRQEERNRMADYLSFAAGFAEMTILSTFLYFTCRLSVQSIRIVWVLLGSAALFSLMKRRMVTRSGLTVLGCVMILWLFMLLPGLVKGDQYYVYRGNCTDQQTYVEETVALSMHPIGWYESRTEEQVGMISDVLWRGYRWAVRDRPSAGLMIAVMRWNNAGEIYWVLYLFRMFMQAMIMPSIFYLFQVTTDRRTANRRFTGVIGILAAALYSVGFWGQIQYDIDAVSQMSSIAVLAALTAVFFQYAQEVIEGKRFDGAQYGLMVLLASAGLALYLESALVHGGLYLLTGILLLLHRRKRLTWKSGVQLLCIPVLSIVIMIMSNYRIMGFLRAQVLSSVNDERQSWANYFNQWWLGKYGIDGGRITGPVSKMVNWILSVSGMYNMTVNYEKYYGGIALVLTVIAAVLAFLVLLCLLRPLFEKEEQSIWIVWILLMVGIAILIGMCVCKKYWSAGKLLYYISPYLYVFFCIPVLQTGDRRTLTAKLTVFLAVVMLFSNAKMVLERIYDTKVNWACTGYRGNYPSDMIPGLKQCADFSFDAREVKEADGVIIRNLDAMSDHRFYLQYLKVKLTCAGIIFLPEEDVNYYGNKVEVSAKRSLEGKNILTLEAVKNENGRYVIRMIADSRGE